MNKTEFLKMALEKLTAASNYIDTLGGVSKGYRMDIERFKAALEANNKSVDFYGYCPICNAKGLSRERHPNGSDVCTNGHIYESKYALTTLPQRKPLTEGEIEKLFLSATARTHLDAAIAFARAIEAAHGIKGEA